MVKSPVADVVVATVVPFTVTVANATGELSLAFFTLPVTFVCARRVPDTKKKNMTVHSRTAKQSIFCLISGVLWLFEKLGLLKFCKKIFSTYLSNDIINSIFAASIQ